LPWALHFTLVADAFGHSPAAGLTFAPYVRAAVASFQ
jgi:hypothetical protein